MDDFAHIKTMAAQWRQDNGYTDTGGVIVTYQNEVQGWVNELRDPSSWQPGCIATDSEGNQWQAAGGNEQDGAAEWQAVAPVPVLIPRCDQRLKATKPCHDLSLKMYIRFLEVIQLDLDALLNHINDITYVSHNTLKARGFIDNLALSYSDQDCDGFLQLLTDLQGGFKCFHDPHYIKDKVLMTMKLRVSSLLDTLRDRAEAGDE